MDERTEKSFNKLKSYVLNDAYNRREELTAEFEAEINDRLDAKRAEFETAAQKKLQKDIGKIKRDSTAAVAEYELKAKKDLMSCRGEIVNAVFSGVMDRIAEFKKTSDYEIWLRNKTKDAIKSCGDGNVTIFCSYDDAPKLSEFGNNIETCDILCGVRVENMEKGIVADYVVDEIISEEKEKFLKNSGMTIEI